MKLAEFERDDRFATIDSTEIGCHGGNGPRDVQIGRAAAWMLDPENGDGFAAVLDPYDMTVATLDDDGDVVWEPLADFEA